MLRPWIAAIALCVVTCALGPLLPRIAFRFEPYHLDAFGIVLERPSTWTKGPDPLGFLAFGNGVDALASIACARDDSRADLEDATLRFIDHELRGLERAGHIGDLDVGAVVDDSIGKAGAMTSTDTDGVIDEGKAVSVAAKRVPFSFLASDGFFQAQAYVFTRGEMECAFVLAKRTSASAKSGEILDEVKNRVQLVETKAQRDAKNAVLNHPDSVKTQLDLALAHQAAGDVDKARVAFEKAETLLANDAGYEGRVRVGRARFELEQGHDLDRALSEAEKARITSNDDPDVAVLLIDVLTARGDLVRAQVAADAAVAQFHDDERLLDRKRRFEELEKLNDETKGDDDKPAEEHAP